MSCSDILGNFATLPLAGTSFAFCSTGVICHCVGICFPAFIGSLLQITFTTGNVGRSGSSLHSAGFSVKYALIWYLACRAQLFQDADCPRYRWPKTLGA